MKIFDAMLIIGIAALIMLGSFYSAAMFEHVSIEGGNGTADNSGVTTYTSVSAWIYIIGALLVVAAIVIALKLYF